MSGFPADADAVTGNWLTRQLKATPLEQRGAVSLVSWEPIGTGQVGDSVRFHLTHAGSDAPSTTLAAKFPAADQASQATAVMLNLYAKEVAFYTDIAPMLAVRTPHVFAGEISEDGSEFVLLFEDLGPARGGNQIAGCSIDDARAAICQAAAFHAPSWHNPVLAQADWLQPSEALNAQIKMLYPEAQKTFAERYGDVLEPEFMALCDTLGSQPELLTQRRAELQCVVHGDFRLDNMLFGIKGGEEPIAVLDWQTVTYGNAMTDIGYFLGCGIGDELRRGYEDELLDLYCAEMTARGVPLTRADIWTDYRKGALHGLTTAVFSAAFVERTERGDANFLSMARGACALALEHDSLGALQS